jgi:hypothetical protein
MNMRTVLVGVLALMLSAQAHAQTLFADTSGAVPRLFQSETSGAAKPGNCPLCNTVTAGQFATLATQVQTAGKPKIITGRALYNRFNAGEKTALVAKAKGSAPGGDTALQWVLDLLGKDSVDLTDPQLASDLNTVAGLAPGRITAILTPQ